MAAGAAGSAVLLMSPLLLLLVLASGLLPPARGSEDAGSDPLVVTTSQGQIRGSIMTALNGNDFYAFRGIPYAEPPVGKRRFKAPVASTVWHGVRDATQEGSVCAQVPLMGNDTFIGSENCLFLNVYTPQLSADDGSRLPVIFWIHGGAFYAGDGGVEENGPEFLMEQPLVLVTINYRLGPFGFLSSGDQVIPGNFGLKDQVLALKWVRDNIEYFAGDPDRVTLYGYSSGAVCVQAHLFSPLSKGLFHGAVYQSGSMSNECTLRSRPAAVLQVLGSVVKCEQTDTKAQLACLRDTPASQLAKAIYNFPSWGIKIPQAYSPVQEWARREEQWEEEPFLPEDPAKMLAEGRIVSDVPIITGVAQDEGVGFAAMVVKSPDLLRQLEEHFEEAARLGLCLYRLNVKKFASIKDFYFGEKAIDASQLESLTQMFSDALFTWGQVRTATSHAAVNTKPVYFYVFSFEGRITELMAFNFTEPIGVGHADDLAYVFRRRIPFPEGGPNDEERATIARMGHVLVNFASTGDPTPTNDPMFPDRWLPLPREVKSDAEQFRYLEISKLPAMRQGRPFPERMTFWEQVRRKKKRTTPTPDITSDEAHDEL